jgi:hypothetical protein
MTSTDFRATADHIERLCIVACRARQSHVACAVCKSKASALREFAQAMDDNDPRTVNGRAKQGTLRTEGAGDARKELNARTAEVSA